VKSVAEQGFFHKFTIDK